jgi:ABC-type phosphate/phosphonate transport system substrate-binding protein
MNWKVALPMYNVSPRVQREYEALLACLLVDAGLQEEAELLVAPELNGFWRSPEMLVGQTCGYPYMTALRGVVTLLATPCFDFPGCDGSNYASAIIVRADADIRVLADARGLTAAANDLHSNSGMNVLRHAVAPLAHDGRFFGAVKWSGSHAASLRMVRDGEADIAAIDCATYGYLKQELPDSVSGVRILQYTASSPGLPLVVAHAVSEALQHRLREALLAPSAQLCRHMAVLHINAFEHRTDADYKRILHIEAEARAAGYAALA